MGKNNLQPRLTHVIVAHILLVLSDISEKCVL